MKWAYAEFEIRNAAQAEGASHDVSFPLPRSSFRLPVLRFHRRTRAIARPDLTAVIGVGCLAIFLFLLALSFAAADQDRLTGPPDVAPATLRITSAGQVLLGGETIEVASLPAALTRHTPVTRGNPPEPATLILCADGGAAAGVVRRVIKICQDAGFQRFLLRDAASRPGPR
jgi:biopolymer transport protein ExbD